MICHLVVRSELVQARFWEFFAEGAIVRLLSHIGLSSNHVQYRVSRFSIFGVHMQSLQFSWPYIARLLYDRIVLCSLWEARCAIVSGHRRL